MNTKYKNIYRLITLIILALSLLTFVSGVNATNAPVIEIHRVKGGLSTTWIEGEGVSIAGNKIIVGPFVYTRGDGTYSVPQTTITLTNTTTNGKEFAIFLVTNRQNGISKVVLNEVPEGFELIDRLLWGKIAPNACNLVREANIHVLQIIPETGQETNNWPIKTIDNDSSCASAEIDHFENSDYPLADIAENFKSIFTYLEAGDVVIIDQTETATIKKSQKAYDPNIIGVVSANPAQILNNAYEEDAFPISLTGQVPVKISTSSAPVKPGDPLTSSPEPGKSMKAEKSGPILGKALESWNPDSGKDKILVFVNLSWYDPDVFLTSTGELRITNPDEPYDGLLTGETEIQKLASQDSFGMEKFKMQNYSAKFKIIKEETGEVIERIVTAADGVFARVKAGLVETQNLIAENIIVEKKLISPLIETEQLTADSIQATESKFDKLISTEIETDKLQVNTDATVAGTLHAKKIVAEEIVGLKGKFGELIAATVSAERIEGLEERLAQLEMAPSPTPSPEPVVEEEPAATESSTLLAGDIEAMVDEILNSSLETFPQADLTDINGEDLKIANSLTVLGLTSLADTSVAGNLSVDGTLAISGNSIDTLTDTLYLQSLGLGGVDILAGKIVIDGSGNLTVSGDVTVKGSLFANIISPLPEQDLVINLKNTDITDANTDLTDSGFGRLIVKGVDEEVVASIEATGTATFKKLAIAKAEEEVTQVSETEVETNATAGKAVLPDGETEITIKSQFVTDKTMIYVTPTSDTQNKVLFVKAKKGHKDAENDENGYEISSEEKGWFTVAIDTAIDKDIEFNWWIIN